MSVRKKIHLSFIGLISLAASLAFANNSTSLVPKKSDKTIASLQPAMVIPTALGWNANPESFCGGVFTQTPIIYPAEIKNTNAFSVKSKSSIFSQQGTSILSGSVRVVSVDQEMLSDRAYIYRDAKTSQWNILELIGDVHYRLPNTLIIAKKGRYFFQTKNKSLIDIIYRTDLANDNATHPTTAWGTAKKYEQNKSLVEEFSDASFSTCSPTNPAWQVRAKNIILDKNTGRGYATHARILVKNYPVFYFPYINFSIDKQRKSGFLWPVLGVSSKLGPYFLSPFYWNLAPNYDLTLTPGILTKRGFQLDSAFRYLTESSEGFVDFFVLPNDKAFAEFQKATDEKSASFGTDPAVLSQLNRLHNYSTTRKGLIWRDKSFFNEHWSGVVDFNYVGDDYLLKDFGKNLNDVTDNQLLQLAEVTYKNQHWNVLGRVQQYQTLHPLNESVVLNQYKRYPQIIISGDYPDQPLGLEYFINSDLAHFEIVANPGAEVTKPVGHRFHFQPGVSLPLSLPFFFITPRLQLAMTQYELYHNSVSNTPGTQRRVLPIFDVFSGIALNREWNIFNHEFRQVLEPQMYYTFIPYRKQSAIPVFDTTVNTLTYDQIFNYNRFTGIDRIGDANQIALGVTTRFIDNETGIEKIRLGVGEILYFKDRKVTLCNDNSCADSPGNRSNTQRISPISGVLDYHVNDHWKAVVNTIWNPISRQVSNSSITFQYHPAPQKIVNLGFNYARSGDVLSGISTTDARNNLKVSDISFSWPILQNYSAVGRWSQNWNHAHLQNLLYGIQYDTCCWAVRLVGGKAFINFDTKTNKAQYNSEFYLQFSLKGLGELATGNPTNLLKTVTGYETKFGQDIS